MSGMGLTAKARELLVYIKTRELCPSLDEMRDALGLTSKSSIGRLLDQLEERGYIRRLRNRARAIEVIRDLPVALPPTPLPGYGPGWPRIVTLPLWGRINVGEKPSRSLDQARAEAMGSMGASPLRGDRAASLRPQPASLSSQSGIPLRGEG